MIGSLKRFGWAWALALILLCVIIAIFLIINRAYNDTSKLNGSGDSEKSNTISKTISQGAESELADVSSGDYKPNSENEPDVKEISNLNSDISSNSSSKLEDITKTDEVKDVAKKANNDLATELKKQLKEESGSLAEKTKVETSVAESEERSLSADESSSVRIKGDLDSAEKASDESRKVDSDQLLALKEPNSINPEVDLFRVEESGEAIIAGQAEPLTEVEVISNDDIVGKTVSDEDGNFVVIGSIEKSDEVKKISVRAKKLEEAKVIEKHKKPQAEIEKLAENNRNEKIQETDQEKLNISSDWALSEDIFIVLPIVKVNENSNAIESTLPTIVQSSTDEIKLVQNIKSASVSEVTLDTISYSDLGEAILAGRARPKYTILIYVDNDLFSKGESGAAGGWSVELTGLMPGIYKLRIDEVDDEGVVNSRIETPFKRVSSEILTNMVSGAITVQSGNSLWRIARRIFGKGIRYLEIYEENSDLIKDPDLIYPGQVFSIPTKL